MSAFVADLDRATAEQLLDALRVYEGRLAGGGKRLCPGVLEIRKVIQRMQGSPEVGPSADSDSNRQGEVVTNLLTLPEAAEQLHVGLTTLKTLVRDGDLPSILIGSRARRVHADDLATYIEARRSES